MLEIHNAVEAPFIESTSGSLSGSTDITVQIIWTSFLYPFGNRGRRGLSIDLAESIAFSVGLPSLFTKPPGILPTEYNLSSYSTLRGKKSIPSLGSFDALALIRTAVSPYFIYTDPFESIASFPVSTSSSLPEINVLKLCTKLLPPFSLIIYISQN
jgi:hypothetical protein